MLAFFRISLTYHACGFSLGIRERASFFVICINEILENTYTFKYLVKLDQLYSYSVISENLNKCGKCVRRHGEAEKVLKVQIYHTKGFKLKYIWFLYLKCGSI